MATKKHQYSSTYLLTVDGASLTRARLAKGFGVADVVKELGDGMNKSTVSRWETGMLQPSPQRLFALVDLFGANDFVRLNGKAVLTSEEIEVVRKLREG